VVFWTLAMIMQSGWVERAGLLQSQPSEGMQRAWLTKRLINPYRKAPKPLSSSYVVARSLDTTLCVSRLCNSPG
jgi:hypothetical protein